MRKKFTLTHQRKNLKNNNNKKRHAISGIIEALLLISIVIISLGIVGIGLTQINLETLSCNVELLEVYNIGDNNGDEYWVDMIILNNGDYTYNATLKYFENITITNLKHDSFYNIRPANTTNIEFQFTGSVGKSILMGLDIINYDQKTFCIKEVNI